MSDRKGVFLAPTAVSITLGGGARLSITQDDDLLVEDDFVRFSLGRCTLKRIEALKGFLDRLKCHAVKE